MKYRILSNWNGWDNKKNLKGEEIELTNEEAEHLTNANVKLQPLEVDAEDNE